MPRRPTGQLVVREGKAGRVFAARFRANRERHYVTLGSEADGWTHATAKSELENILADVRRGIWRPPAVAVVDEPTPEPTFHEFASEWIARREKEVSARTSEHWRWALSVHLLPVFQQHRLVEVTAEAVDRYKTAKLAEDEPLSASSI